MYINLWLGLGISLTIIIVGALFVDDLYKVIKKERVKRQDLDERNSSSFKAYDDRNTRRFDTLEIAIHALSDRLDKIECPGKYDQLENKVCPECGEEKEMREDDYICSACRGE